jgi:SAM-dependent methyltransferase
MFMAETEENAVRNGDSLLEVVDGLYDDRGLVLDIGCGYGRLAYALYRRGFEGDYLGYDVKRDAIGWLTDNFTPVAPRYRFMHTDVHNDRYNPKGEQAATDLPLGVVPKAPTLILLLSVFTHMYGEDIARYLETVANVMDDRTLLYVTFFLLNPEQQALEDAGRTARPFRHIISEHCRYFSSEDPLWAIAFTDEWVNETVSPAGLQIEKKLYGFWAGRRNTKVFQGTLLIRKAEGKTNL